MMNVHFFCPLWGSAHLKFDDFLQKVKQAGYDGVEMSLPFDTHEKQALLDAIRHYELEFIAQHAETCTPDFARHKAEYERRLRNLASANPLVINSQTGRDSFSFEQNAELIELAGNVSQESGVKILHETHRGKFSFAAHVAKRFLEHFKDLRLCLDISHWCTVAESLLHDQEDAVQFAISRADHIHSRVGFEEGPQIPDPRVPEWEATLQRHLEWWDAVIERARQEKHETFTITSEFGPFPYMQLQPFTRMPLSNQWEINCYMKDLLSTRYN